MFAPFCLKLSKKFEELKSPNAPIRLFYTDDEEEMIEIDDDDDFETALSNMPVHQHDNEPIYHLNVEYEDEKGTLIYEYPFYQ